MIVKQELDSLGKLGIATAVGEKRLD